MDDSSTNSVTRVIAALKDGDAEAARLLWERYFERLVEAARHRLGTAFRPAADEEDVALSVFHRLCKGAADGRFQRVTNRDELWLLLLKLTKCKVVDQIRREKAQKRGSGQVYTFTSAGAKGTQFDINEVMSQVPTPEFMTSFQEEYERLLSLLRNDQIRNVAILRMEGHSTQEISDAIGVSVRAIERKLRLIRERWAKETELSRGDER